MKVLAVGAHPDDIEFFCAGTLAKYKRLGHETAIAIATNGDVGSSKHTKNEIAAIRKRESEASAGIISAELYWMGYPDEFLFSNEESRLKFIDIVRQARPDLIICCDPAQDYHPDHTTSGQIIWDIHVMVTVPNIVTDHPPCQRIPEIVYMDTPASFNSLPNRYVDITADFETKTKMLACHDSQSDWVMGQYKVTFLEHMESIARLRGLQCSCRYAEAFRIPAIWPRKVEPEGLIL